MKSGWLRQYFTPQHNELCHHTTIDLGTPEAAALEDGVSRRDFVKGGLVASMAAGIATSGTAGGVPQAEAQAENPMGKEW
jgi:hypothetical protein